MNLAFLRKSDKELNELRWGDNLSLIKEAKTEISRRRAVGSWDGTMAVQVDATAEMEVEKSTEYVYASGVQPIL